MPPTFTDEGLRAAAAIRSRHPRIGIMILSQHVDVGIAMRALAEDPAGLGYLLKDRVVDIEDFAGALRRVAAGGSALDPAVVAGLLDFRREDAALGGALARASARCSAWSRRACRTRGSPSAS